jgi:hypothetical protein
MDSYPSLKPLKLIKPKEDKENPIKGMIKVSQFNRQSFGKMFKKERAR